jgi:tetratricopeptide (TPR) repeat protein
LWLLPIFLFWVNTHIYFFIGLALLFFKWLAEFCEMIVSQRQSGLDWLVSCRAAYLKSRPWFYILWGSTLVCLLNPHHIVGLLYPFNIFSHYGYEIVENKSIFFLGHLLVDYNFSLFKILLVSLWLIWLLYFFICRRVSWFNLFLTLFFSALALMAVRNLPLFGLVWLVLVSANLSELLAQIKEKIPWSGWEIIKRWRIAIGLALLVVIICVGIYLAVTAVDQEGFIREPLGWGLTAGGEDSAKFFRDQHLSGPIFNNYDVGSALIFWLYPQTKVFVDNRPEAYSEQFFSSIYKPMQSEPAKWQAYSRQYQIKTVYFGYTDSAPWAVSFLNYILSDPDWALLYFDRYTVILANKKLTETSLLKNQTIGVTAFRQRLRELVTTSDLRSRFNLASLAKANRQNDLAEEIYRQIIFSQPTNRQALASLAYLYSGTTDKLYLNLALSYFQRAIEAGNDLPGIFDQLGLVYWHLQDYKNAELSWHLSLGRDSQDAGASYYLKQAADLRAQGKIN